MKKIREWIIRKLGGYPYPLPEPKVELKVEQIPMKTHKIFAEVQYLDDHKPPDSYLEKQATIELAMEMLRNQLIDFDYHAAVIDPVRNPFGDLRQIVASVRIVKKEAS